MKNLNFKYAGAWNFLPFGPDGVEIKFNDYGNIILIEGFNKDSKNLEDEEDNKSNSNGTGKSSIQEIIVFSIYGKTIKRPEKINVDDVVHNKIGKDCRTIIEFDDYRICRTRIENGKKNKNSLRLWKSEKGIWNEETEITLGTMSATQKKIDEIIGLSYESFVNICVFTDDQRSCFLECDKSTKREIVENLLCLGKYREWFENAKSIKRNTKNEIELISKEYKILLDSKEENTKRINLAKNKEQEWRKSIDLKKIEINKKIEENKIKIKDSKEKLEEKNEYEEAQKKIKTINEEIEKNQRDEEDFKKKLSLIDEKENNQKEELQNFISEFNDFKLEFNTKKEEKEKILKEINSLEKEEEGKICTKCKGTIDKKNIKEYISKLNLELKNIEEEMSILKEKSKSFEDKKNDIVEKQNKLKELKSKMNATFKKIETKSSDLRKSFLKYSEVKKPKKENNEEIIKEKIKQFLEELKSVEKETSPFKEIIEEENSSIEKLEKKIEEKEKKIKLLEEKIPYYEFWISGFGEQGLRKWIIEGIIPDLNSRINYWLQFLIDNLITLSFDNELQEKIERNPPDGDPYIYHAMSTGQRRRLNLAVGHSFAYITELSNDSIPNLIFLDEVTTNIDPAGVLGVYKMIKEISENKKVFITTHDQELLKLLEGESKLKLVHENGFTKKI